MGNLRCHKGEKEQISDEDQGDDQEDTDEDNEKGANSGDNEEEDLVNIGEDDLIYMQN